MLNFFRKDFASVRAAIKFYTNDKAPEWAIVIWYVVLAPLGLLLLPIAKIYAYFVLRSLKNDKFED